MREYNRLHFVATYCYATSTATGSDVLQGLGRGSTTGKRGVSTGILGEEGGGQGGGQGGYR